MSIVQIYNYIRRQMRENRMKSDQVLTTWADYLSMACRLKMDTNDAIIYRVRRLRQRHDELVKLCGQKELAIRAGEILEKYPHIEDIYQEVRAIYGYAGEDYTVIVPSQIEEIMDEGKNSIIVWGAVTGIGNALKEMKAMCCFFAGHLIWTLHIIRWRLNRMEL